MTHSDLEQETIMNRDILYGRNPNTSHLLLALQKQGKLCTTPEISERLGDVDATMVDRWMMGDELPPLKILPRLAEIADINHECLVITWLSDSDRKNGRLYQVMAIQLMKAGGPTANPFFRS
jgi:hypothetical protein